MAENGQHTPDDGGDRPADILWMLDGDHRTGTRESAVRIPIAQLRAASSPRLDGENEAHVQMMSALDASSLPPVVVNRQTMQIVDGMHRLRAAALRGDTAIEVVFFEGSDLDAFAYAVRANVSHGLPLSLSDRVAAARRILASHTSWSDRAVAECSGLSATTVARLRSETPERAEELGARVGRDGKVRPLDSSRGRQLARELLVANPAASLREVAKAASISPNTVRDVKERLNRGEDSQVKGKQASRPDASALAPTLAQLLRSLQRDPSFRSNAQGRALIRLFGTCPADPELRERILAGVPPHCMETVASATRQFAASWQEFASELTARHERIAQ